MRLLRRLVRPFRSRYSGFRWQQRRAAILEAEVARLRGCLDSMIYSNRLAAGGTEQVRDVAYRAGFKAGERAERVRQREEAL